MTLQPHPGMRLKRQRMLRTMLQSPRSRSPRRNDAPALTQRSIDRLGSSRRQSVVLLMQPYILNIINTNRLKRPQPNMERHRLNLHPPRPQLRKNLRRKVKPRSRRSRRSRFTRKHRLVAVFVLLTIIAMDIRRQRHMPNLIENRLKIRHRIEPKRPLPKVASRENLRLKKRFCPIRSSKMKPLSRLNLATGSHKGQPIFSPNVFSKKHFNTASRIGRTRLRMDAAGASGIETSRNDAAIVEDQQIASAKKMRQVTKEVIAVFGGGAV